MKKNIIWTLVIFFLFAILSVFLIFEKDVKQDPDINKLVISLSGNPISLDPQKTSDTLSIQASKNFYNTIFEFDSENDKIVPILAKSYNFSEDNLTLNLELKDNIYFSDNQKFVAKDVKASLLRLKSPTSPHQEQFENISDIKILDDLNLQIKLKKPFRGILYNFCETYSSILPYKKIEEDWDFSSHPIGTGILEFIKRQENDFILAKVKKNHFLNKTNLDEVEFKIIQTPNTLIEGLMTQNLDLAIIRNKDMVDTLNQKTKVNITPYLSYNTIVLSLNNDNPILSDINFRKSLAYGIDSQKIIDAVYGGGKKISTFMTVSSPYYKDFEYYQYNLEKAKEFLKKSSYSGQTLNLSLPSNYPEHVRAGVIVQNQLKKIGVKIKIQEITWNNWMSEIYRKSKFDLTIIAHTGMINPLSSFRPFLKKESNYLRYDNPKIKDFFDLASQGEDYEKPNIEKIESEFAKDLPFVYIGTNYNYIASQNNISGVKVDRILDEFLIRNIIKK